MLWLSIIEEMITELANTRFMTKNETAVKMKNVDLSKKRTNRFIKNYLS